MLPNISEEMRLHALQQLKILDTAPSESFDRITRMASRVFNLPIAAVSLTDRDRQWFKSRVGVDHWEIPREKAPCGEVAISNVPLVIPDLLKSRCYRNSVLADAGIRFYAGAPLTTRDGFTLGAMCVLGTEPRQISADEEVALADLAAMVMAQIELQHAVGRIEPVSGLPNRHQFLDDLADQARDHAGAFRSAAILEMVETGRLSEALRVLGPNAIDTLVRDATRMLAEALGPEQKVYQVGPVQFAWVLSHPNRKERDKTLAGIRDLVPAKLCAGTAMPLAQPVLGIAPFRLGEVSAADVIRTAHSAAHEARASDSLVKVYSEAADDKHRRRFQLLADFQAALMAMDQLSLVYQPRIDLKTGNCAGTEALLRWSHPVFGNVSPAEFIPVVEQSDMARPLTEWVIETALAQVSAWKRQGLHVPVSVNVSVGDLEDKDFAARLIGRLKAAGLSPGAIEIEVTESALIQDGTRVGLQLQQVRQAGVTVAIDDFGTGYSSLSYLQNLPADVVKIDQSFIRNLTTNERGQTLVRQMIAMAQSLDLRVVAEGVEDAEAYASLRSWSCDEAQGYLIERPLTPEAFVTWLGKNIQRTGCEAA